MKQHTVRLKLKSRRGETLAELLVSVLVMVLALTMFASALMASRKMLAGGDVILDTYYHEHNELEREANETDGTLHFRVKQGTNYKNTGFTAKAVGEPGRYSIHLYSEKENSSGTGTGTSAQFWRYSR